MPSTQLQPFMLLNSLFYVQPILALMVAENSNYCVNAKKKKKKKSSILTLLFRCHEDGIFQDFIAGLKPVHFEKSFDGNLVCEPSGATSVG